MHGWAKIYIVSHVTMMVWEHRQQLMSWRSWRFMREERASCTTAVQKLGKVPFFMPFPLINEACTSQIVSEWTDWLTDCQRGDLLVVLWEVTGDGKTAPRQNWKCKFRCIVRYYPSAIDRQCSFSRQFAYHTFQRPCLKRTTKNLKKGAWCGLAQTRGVDEIRITDGSRITTIRIILILRRTVLCTCYIAIDVILCLCRRTCHRICVSTRNQVAISTSLP